MFVAVANPIFYLCTICYIATRETSILSVKAAQDITAIGIFSITITFFLLEIKDMFYGQAMKQIGREERDREISQILDAALKEDPPPSAEDLVQRVYESRKKSPNKTTENSNSDSSQHP
ncbi:MAG: hypothetical protein J4F39_17990 [Candidatus Latescibacteria bacterium]|nr:hypothetical protein [Candidatus Latescibacterota bacterium]